MSENNQHITLHDTIAPNLYFIGAGGIGMANLIRYFLSRGHNIAGYDRVRSDLSSSLEQEGAQLVYDDENPQHIPTAMLNPDSTLVVYTPAIPDDNRLLQFFRQGGYRVIKRAALLGEITRDSKGICIAGSHGKTTTCSMTANILRNARPGCNAFLGGILRNIDSNLVLTPGTEYSVIEADEYDRSFHHLTPYIAVVTSTDPDHLDIYGDETHYLEAFRHFTELVRPGGYLLLHTGLKLNHNAGSDVTVYTYGTGAEADYRAENITYENGHLYFDIIGPDITLERLEPGPPIEINIENATAAAVAAHLAGADEQEIRHGLAEYKGAKRRFEIHLQPGMGRAVLIDDYAHSPREIEASIDSVRRIFPGRELTVIFQPHLYTRTRDFADDFALALSKADRIIMPEIYPAREEPIPGVDSELILKKIKNAKKSHCRRSDLVDLIKTSNFDILMTLGAADLDRLLPQIKLALQQETVKPSDKSTDTK